MVNYQNGKIYTIRCRSDDTLIYVGSTTRALSQRMTEHRSCCKRGDGCSLYDYIIDNDWSDFYIELYEAYPCNSKEELCKKEGEVIRQIGTINKCIAGRSCKGWCEDNAEKLKENKKKYYKDNAEYFKEKSKTYHKNNAEKIKEKNKERSKKFYEDNKDKNKEKVCCDICGAFIRKDGLTRHKKKYCLVIASKK